MEFKNQAKFEEFTQALNDGKVIKQSGGYLSKKINNYICRNDKGGRAYINCPIHLEDCQILEPEIQPVTCKCGNEPAKGFDVVTGKITHFICDVCGQDADSIESWNEFQETYKPKVKLYDVREINNCKYIITLENDNSFDIFFQDGRAWSEHNNFNSEDKLLARCSSLKEATEFMFKD